MSDFAGLARKLDRLTDDLTGKGSRRILSAAGKQLAPLVNKAVADDIGDLSMSGWRRGNPRPIKGRYTISDSGLALTPTAPGHMRVLEQGRNQGNAGGFAGPGIGAGGLTARAKSGAVRKVRARRGRRWNGSTQGKGTWSDASAQIATEAPRVLNEEKVAAMARYFTRG